MDNEYQYPLYALITEALTPVEVRAFAQTCKLAAKCAKDHLAFATIAWSATYDLPAIDAQCLEAFERANNAARLVEFIHPTLCARVITRMDVGEAIHRALGDEGVPESYVSRVLDAATDKEFAGCARIVAQCMGTRVGRLRRIFKGAKRARDVSARDTIGVITSVCDHAIRGPAERLFIEKFFRSGDYGELASEYLAKTHKTSHGAVCRMFALLPVILPLEKIPKDKVAMVVYFCRVSRWACPGETCANTLRICEERMHGDV